MLIDPVTVHQLFGVLVLGFAGALLMRALDVIGTRWDYLPAIALLSLGGLLFADPWLFHGGDFGAEGHQHIWQGALLAAAGAAEWLRVRRQLRQVLSRLVVPAVVAALGAGFLWHEQHASGDMLLQTVQHRIMGMTLLVAALVKLAADLQWRGGHWGRSGWALVLVVFAGELLLYTEAGLHGGH